MIHRFLRNTVAAAALALGLASTAHAAPFALRVAADAVGNANVAPVFVAEEVWREVDMTVGGTRYEHFGVGLFKLEWDDLATGAEVWTALNTFCFEVLPALHDGTFTAANLNSVLPGTATQIRRLWANEFLSATDGTGPLADSQNRAAAFQIAVWELIDGVDGLTTGDFNLHTTDTALIAQINAYLAVAAGGGSAGVQLGVLQNDVWQDQLYVLGNGAPNPADDPVPAPATLALLGAALAGLGTLRARKRG